MLRLKTVTIVSLLGLGFAFACSSEDDPGGTSGGAASGSGAANGVGANGSGTAASGVGANGAGTAANGAGANSGIGANGAGTAASGVGANGVGANGAGANGAGANAGTLDGGAAGPSSDWDVNVVTDACVDLSIGTNATPAMLQFVIDKSTSMNQDTLPSTNGATKWEATRDALIAAFPQMDPSLAVGEFFYPSVAHNENQCLPGCADDTGGVPIAPLDAAQVQALQDGARAVPNPTTPPGTPTHDAWRVGLLRLQQALANPPPGYENARGYIVLMTDGMPTLALNCTPSYGCLNNNGAPGGVDSVQWQEIIDDVAQTTAATQIQTFVIGAPGSEDDRDIPVINGQKDYVARDMLSALAIAGQTAIDGCNVSGPNYCHIDMVETDDFVTSLVTIIGEIASSIVSCEYAVPQLPPEQNVFVNPDDVAVHYYTGTATDPIPLTRSNDGCATGEWMYNDDQTNIILCDSSCTTVRNDNTARIEVYFGCVGVL
jgi:hypothetical protein